MLRGKYAQEGLVDVPSDAPDEADRWIGAQRAESGSRAGARPGDPPAVTQPLVRGDVQPRAAVTSGGPAHQTVSAGRSTPAGADCSLSPSSGVCYQRMSLRPPPRR